tara:strand:+ start:1517 stop:1771 length:255 start_codon:yes stop_codon:yes gene_type:complete
MNTSITSENKDANSLLELIETYDNINIVGVSKIVGTSAQISNIIDSGKFTGFNTTNLFVTGITDSTTLSYLDANTTGTIEHSES